MEKLAKTLRSLQDSHPAVVWCCTVLVVFLVVLVPLQLVAIPPLLDYPNHLARMYVEAHPENAVVRSFYRPAWGIVPYSFSDIVAWFLQKIVPLTVAGRILLAMGLVMPVLGGFLYNKAIYGRLSLWPLLLVTMSYNSLFLLGFYNFYIGCGAGLGAAACYILLSRRSTAACSMFSILAVTVLFFIHIYGSVFYLLLAGSREFAEFTAHKLSINPFARLMVSAARLLPALLVLSTLATVSHIDGLTSDRWYGPVSYKLSELATPWLLYRSQDAIIAIFLYAALFTLFGYRLVTVTKQTLFAASACGVMFLILPFQVSGAQYLSTRFLNMMCLVILAGLRPTDRMQVLRPVVSLVCAGLIVSHLTSVGTAWSNEDRDMQKLRDVTDRVEPGKKVLYVTATRQEITNYRGHAPFGERLLYYPAYIHFPAILVFERSAFWPFLLSVPGTSPIRIQPAFERLTVHCGAPPPYDSLDPLTRTDETLAQNPFVEHWQRDFDYVLLLPIRAVPEAATIFPDKLALVAINDFAALYRVKPLPDPR